MSELLPCPFCGGEAEVIEAGYGMYMTGYAVYCKKCCLKLGVTGRLGETYEWSPVFDTEAEAAEAWNRRAAVTDHDFAMAVHDGNLWRRMDPREPAWEMTGSTQTQEFWMCSCAECGHEFGIESRESFPFKMTVGKVKVPNFCPDCGTPQREVLG